MKSNKMRLSKISLLVISTFTIIVLTLFLNYDDRIYAKEINEKTSLFSKTSSQYYYVSPNGSDNNSGALNAPWKTIRRAAATLRSGETAIIMDGIYEESYISFANSGTKSNPITLRAQHKWKAIVNSTSGCNPAFYIYQSYITIRDLRISVSPNNIACTIKSSANGAARCWESNEANASSTSTGLAGCTFKGVLVDPSPARSVGIKTNQDYSLVEDSEIHSSLEAFNNYGTIFRNNVIYGGDVWGDSLYGKGGVRNLQIYNNIVHLSGQWTRGIFLGGNSGCCWYDSNTHIEAYNSVAYNNVVINEGLDANVGSLGLLGTKDSAVFNNIAIGGYLFSYTGSEAGFSPQPIPVNSTMVNNIIDCKGRALTSGGFAWLYSEPFNYNYNEYFNCSSGPNQNNGVLGDPLFVNPLLNWHLKSGSPALKAGTTVKFTGFNGEIINVSKNKDGVVRSIPWNLGVY